MGYADDHQWSQRHLSHYVEGDLNRRARLRSMVDDADSTIGGTSSADADLFGADETAADFRLTPFRAGPLSVSEPDFVPEPPIIVSEPLLFVSGPLDSLV